MLVRYKGQKNGCPVKVPVGLKSHGAMKAAKTIWLRPTAELPDAEALKLVKLDPYNFEIVEGKQAPVSVVDTAAALSQDEKPSPQSIEAVEAHLAGDISPEGLELDADPKPAPKKRGRRSKAQMLALKHAKEANA